MNLDSPDQLEEPDLQVLEENVENMDVQDIPYVTKQKSTKLTHKHSNAPKLFNI